MRFKDKLPIYFGENLLAKSLSPECYRNNPQFLRFIESHGLRFRAYEEFDKKALLERQELYEEIAKKIWGVQRLKEMV